MKKSNEKCMSIIVPTYNSSRTLSACLESIANQTYKNIELIVVDNNSADNTKDIAEKYTKHVYNKGPERSAQRNYGVRRAKGDYVMIIDSDMELSPEVAAECIEQFSKDKITGIIIPEESFGEGFWAQAKQLERSFYLGVDWMEAARCFPKKIYDQLGGYNEDMVSGEDWDLSQRADKLGTLGRIQALIMHNEGRLKLHRTLKKKYYYAQKISAYTAPANGADPAILAKQTSPFSRYQLYFSDPQKLFRNPVLGSGMLFMKTAELGFGAIGIIASKLNRKKV